MKDVINACLRIYCCMLFVYWLNDLPLSTVDVVVILGLSGAGVLAEALDSLV